MSELKRCPFCGGEPKISVYDPYDGYQGNCTIYKIQCHKCGVKVESSFRDTCINLWNRRLIDHDDAELIRLMMLLQCEYLSLCNRRGGDYSGAIALSKAIKILNEVYHAN